MTSMVAPPAGARAAFLTELIDDAGMFPPALLPLPDAVARHRQDRAARGWLLGRLLCPASRLDELATVDHAGWRLGVVCDRTAPPSWAEGLDVDLAAVRSFLPRSGGTIDAVELRLPAAGAAAAVAHAVDQLADLPAGPVRAFLELPLAGDGWSDTLAAVADAVASARAGGAAVGLKIRCGGATLDAYPPAGRIAAVLAACAQAGIPLKATAGLHHPLRQPDPDTGAVMHGFFNLVGAAALLVAGAISTAEVAEVVKDSEAASFSLDESGFAWRDRRADEAAIRRSRMELFTGFGSCSIDEPVDDLVSLGVLR